MKNKASKVLDIICTTVIMFVCYFMGWMTLPTISSLPEQTQISSEVLKWLYEKYLENEELYIIVMLFITAILSYILYSCIKKAVQMKYSNVYKKDRIQNVYTDFMKDAKKLYIIGGDLDFFNDAKVQLEKVKALGNNCKILCSKSSKDKTKDLYKNLSDAGVELKVYSRQVNESLKNIRGQIKISTTGNQECLFVNRQEVKSKTEYEVVAMQNKYFTEVMRNLFNQTFEQAHNPLIKLICFDMGGVYFDGDFNKDFLEVINGYLSKNIRANHKQKLILDEELNLGKKNIIDWVEDKVGKSLTLVERNFVEETWKKFGNQMKK